MTNGFEALKGEASWPKSTLRSGELFVFVAGPHGGAREPWVASNGDAE
jgi:hypothetical protein